jgi:hypothetical protein
MAKRKKIFKEITDAKGAYHSALEIITLLLNEEISLPKAEATARHLKEANITFALQIKYAEMTKDPEKLMNKFTEKID